MSPSPQMPLIRVKCLLVDDLQENLLALSALLESPEVEIITANSGAEALEALLKHEVALALLDVQMPDMDGFELAELIRGSARTRDIPLVFVTAGVRDQMRVFQGYELGAVDFLYKPIDPYILRSKAEVFFQLYRQKQQLARELNERSEALRLTETFVAMLSHDLRTPLSAMMMSAALLKRRATTDEVLTKTASRIQDSGKRMSAMIEEMLDMARARLGGGIKLTRGEFDLGELVRKSINELEAAIPDARIVYEKRSGLAGHWDAERLGQVITNLIGNALHHGAGGRPVEVVADGSDASTVHLRITNDGAIPADQLPHIFKPFHGGGGRSNGRDEGLGLGLYIVSEIVKAHAGSVQVLPCEGNRTCFEVSLPRSA